MVSLNTTNTLVVYLGIVFFCLGGVSVLGFNDEAGTVKWSPKYLYEKVYSVPSSVPSKNKLIPSSLPVDIIIRLLVGLNMAPAMECVCPIKA